MMMIALRAAWGFLTSKLGVGLLCLVVLAGVEWKVYDLGKDSVRAEADKEIATAKKDRDDKVAAIQTKYDKLVSDTDAWKASVVAAQKAAEDAQATIVVALQAKLTAAQKQRDKLKLQLKELPKYVTVQADANCTITSGFVSVYNAAVQAAPIPDSGAGNVDAASGVTLSQLATVESSNLAECNERGRVIDAWQEWYAKNKAYYDDVMSKSK